MNKFETDVAISLLIESACRDLEGNPMSEKELMDRFDEATDLVRVCLDAAIEGARQGVVRRSEEERD